MRTIRLWFILALCCLTLIPSAFSQDDPSTSRRIYLQLDNLIFLIDPHLDPPTLETIATLPSTIQCSRWASGNEWLIVSAENGIYRLHHATFALETLFESSDFGDDTRLIVECPMLSPNGEWLAFRTSTPDYIGSLYAAKSDGTELQTLIPEFEFGSDWIGLIAWSNDSERMIFYAGIDDEWGYWQIRPDGTNLEKSEDTFQSQTASVPSPDSEHVASIPWSNVTDPPAELWVDGMLVADIEELIGRESINLFPPVWTPDGDWIILTGMDLTDFLGFEGGTGYLITMRFSPDGGQQETLSTIPYDLNVFIGYLFGPPPPLWSPDRAWSLIAANADLIETETGRLLSLPNVHFISTPQYLWEPASQGLWYPARQDDQLKLMRFDIGTQQAQFVLDLPSGYATIWNFTLDWWD